MQTPDTGTTVLRLLQIILFTSLILYFGSGLLIPMFYGLLIAIVLYPMCRSLEQRGWPRSLAITAGLSIVILLFAALCALFIFQVNMLREDLPALAGRIKPAVPEFQEWLHNKFGIPVSAQDRWWADSVAQFGHNIGSMAQSILSSAASSVFRILLVPVYAVLFLYGRSAFVAFLNSVVGHKVKTNLQVILHDVIHTYSNFIKGMVVVYFIVGCLNTAGLMLLGVPHALLFGMLTAVMTIIPYVGIFISALIPVSVAWITKDSVWYPVGVVAVFAFVQYLEANVIFPKVVGARLNVSTWAMLVAIIAGGLLWGVSGMILFIPFVGILKIVLAYIPEWNSLNILLERNGSVGRRGHKPGGTY